MPTSSSVVVRIGRRIAPILSAFTLLALAACGSEGGGGADDGPEIPSPITDGGAASPTISGTPATSVTVGQAYSFTPQASDPNGDPLTFEIENRPSWATFEATTGRLFGTPSAAGTFAGVRISVTDGRTRASLPAFTVSVRAASAIGNATLSWTAPTHRTDSTPLTNLAGYKIYYGNSPTHFPNIVNVGTPGLTSYVIENLSEGTWYFAVAAVDSTGAESRLSTPASKTIS